MISAEMIITIDGPAGAGKSTAARGLAERLGFEFLDTGAMYRTVAWACLDRGVDLTDSESVAKVAQSLTLTFEGDSVFCDGQDVTSAIRTAESSEAASIVAAVPAVRHEMVRLQREAAANRNVVSEGRDQGTIVFPDADCKFFVTADPKERAVRRHAELVAKGQHEPLDDVLRQIVDRDKRDRTRKVAPLIAPEDALEVDTSSKTQTQVINDLEETARQKLGLAAAKSARE
jgi:cytidylate kinase